VRASDLRATRHLITRLIERELCREHLPPTTFNLGLEEVILARTADRSVLGCMNDMAFLSQEAITSSGGLSHTDLAALNYSLRRNINSARGYQRPIELTAHRLGSKR
jgi:hypothetical protein